MRKENNKLYDILFGWHLLFVVLNAVNDDIYTRFGAFEMVWLANTT